MRLRKLLTAPFVALATVVVLLEDWLWDDLQRLAAAIGRLPIFKQFQQSRTRGSEALRCRPSENAKAFVQAIARWT